MYLHISQLRALCRRKLSKLPLDASTKALRQSGRWCEICLPINEGTQEMIVASLWGISGASGGGQTYRGNERLLLWATNRMLSYQNRPYFQCAALNIVVGPHINFRLLDLKMEMNKK